MEAWGKCSSTKNGKPTLPQSVHPWWHGEILTSPLLSKPVIELHLWLGHVAPAAIHWWSFWHPLVAQPCCCPYGGSAMLPLMPCWWLYRGIYGGMGKAVAPTGGYHSSGIYGEVLLAPASKNEKKERR